MAIGIDEFDEFDDEQVIDTPSDIPAQDVQDQEPENPGSDEQDEDIVEQTPDVEKETNSDPFISELLKSKGIEDPTKIKFENENGEIEEVDWNSLELQDKLSILNSSTEDNDEGLDASEIELINAIRESELSPAEYLQYLQRTSIENYIQNAQSQDAVYSVDQYSDEELYVMDQMSRLGITEEEAMEALERAKSNEALFTKQMGALRNEYKKAEEESLQYSRLKQQQDALDQFNEFAEKIEDSIINFKEFSGYPLNMDDDDMQDLYNFITGTDNAGNSWFGKALSDPDTVVRMAWFELNGDKMIQDTVEYFQKEIAKVRQESYQKGLNAAKKDATTVTYKPKGKSKSQQTFDDLDDDF